jgi:nicotinate-nucleotide adenylyltransferase
MIRLPPFGTGQRIGLFGGSFNPAHKGHVMVALYALKRLKLDWVWWLVSPQNPLKDAGDTGDYDQRFAYTKRLAHHPRFVVTDIERQMKSQYTADTIAQLKRHGRGARFVWIMGADSLGDLHRWHHWQDIANEVVLAVLARPGYSIRALGSKAAVRLALARVPGDRSAFVLEKFPPSWVFVTMPLRPESSTAIRKHRRTVP